MTSRRVPDNKEKAANNSNKCIHQKMENFAIKPYGMSFRQLEEEAARHRCLICGIICKDAPDLSHHRSNKHARYTCGRCNFKCMTINKFISHLKSDDRCKRHFDGETLPSNDEQSATNTEVPPRPVMSGNYFKLPFFVIISTKTTQNMLGSLQYANA